PQPPGRRPRSPAAPDRLLERARLRAQRDDVEGRGSGLPADAVERRGLRRGKGALAGARALSRIAPVTVKTLLCDVIQIYIVVLFLRAIFSWFPPPSGGLATFYR